MTKATWFEVPICIRARYIAWRSLSLQMEESSVPLELFTLEKNSSFGGRSMDSGGLAVGFGHRALACCGERVRAPGRSMYSWRSRLADSFVAMNTRAARRTLSEPWGPRSSVIGSNSSACTTFVKIIVNTTRLSGRPVANHLGDSTFSWVMILPYATKPCRDRFPSSPGSFFNSTIRDAKC